MTAEMTGRAAVPAGLRERVMVASRQARAAGHGVPEVVAASPLEAFRRAADALHVLLLSLRDEDWRAPVLRGLDAQGLVGHLIGVEEHVQRSLSGDPVVAGADHVESTLPWAARQAGRPPAQTREDWRHAVDRTLQLIGDLHDLDGIATVHGVPLPVRDLLVARSFELWTHDNDIRAAIGLPSSVPDAPALKPMTMLATGLLPFAAALAGLTDPVRLHLVLTGPGGGTWDVALGEQHGLAAPVTIVADVVGFCRLFANRVAAADLDAHVTGDGDLAARVLAAASTLALD